MLHFQRMLRVLAAFAALGVVGVAQSKPPTLDKALAKKISALSDRWWKSRPPTRFVEWDAKARSELEAEARALGVIPEGTLREVVDLLWGNAKKLGPKGSLVKGKLTFDTPYGEAWCHVAGTGKKPPLIVGLHGGGEDSGSADESRSTWAWKNCVGIYPQGIRLVHDTWNTVHGERFVLTFIEYAKVHLDVDPDRVVVAGFSMGGSGSWFLAGRHPDLFAGAAPFSGVIMAAPRSQLASKAEVQAIQHGLVPNVRNLAMHYGIGLVDERCMPGTYLFVADLLEKLRSADAEGWKKIHFETYDGLGHEFDAGQPERALKSLTSETRDKFPSRLDWEYVSSPSPEPDSGEPVKRLAKTTFYWIGCKSPEDRQRVRVARAGNEFTLDAQGTRSGVQGLSILLNPAMIDPSQDVVVKSGDVEVYRGKPVPDVWTVLETLDEKLDRSMVFDRRIELGSPPK